MITFHYKSPRNLGGFSLHCEIYKVLVKEKSYMYDDQIIYELLSWTLYMGRVTANEFADFWGRIMN